MLCGSDTPSSSIIVTSSNARSYVRSVLAPSSDARSPDRSFLLLVVMLLLCSSHVCSFDPPFRILLHSQIVSLLVAARSARRVLRVAFWACSPISSPEASHTCGRSRSVRRSPLVQVGSEKQNDRPGARTLLGGGHRY